MTDEHLVWPSWSVDLPGLNEGDARRLLAWAEDENVSLGGSLVDPADWFSLSIDDATAEALKLALDLALRSDSLSTEQSVMVRGFAEDLTEWLSERPNAPGSD